MRTILLVDDEESIRWSFMVMLQKAGYRVFTATDYSSALDLLQQVDVDVLVSDILLPGRSGLDIITWLRKKGRNLPAVLITGQPDMPSMEKSCRLGVFEYLAKPVSRDTLLEVVVRAAEQRDLIKKMVLPTFLEQGDQGQDTLPPQASALQVVRVFFGRELRESLSGAHKREYVVRQLGLLFDNSVLAVVYTRGDAVPYCNESFTRLTGYALEDLGSVDNAFELFYSDAETREHARQARTKAHAQGASSDNEPVFLSLPIRIKDGRVLHLAMCGVFLPESSALYSFIQV